VKLLNILTVMLLLTRTVAAAAGAVSSDPMEADRQWLKQQEDFSEQLRRHPDKALQQELEAQISRNPLARSDQQFIDNLASQQRESTRDKPTEGAVYFISFSIPDEGLKRMLHETHRYGIPATLRGLVNNDMKATTDAVMGLVKAGITEGVQIDPTLYSQYNIRSVPALVVRCKAGFDVIQGNIRLKQALEKVVEKGDCAETARKLLEGLMKSLLLLMLHMFVLGTFIWFTVPACADSTSDYKAGADYRRYREGTDALKNFNGADTLPGYTSKPAQTKYYGGVSASGDSNLKSDSAAEWASSDVGNSITESFTNRPPDSISADAPFIQAAKRPNPERIRLWAIPVRPVRHRWLIVASSRTIRASGICRWRTSARGRRR
jgi:conjugal transfer pilus assembly protein TrbC